MIQHRSSFNGQSVLFLRWNQWTHVFHEFEPSNYRIFATDVTGQNQMIICSKILRPHLIIGLIMWWWETPVNFCRNLPFERRKLYVIFFLRYFFGRFSFFLFLCSIRTVRAMYITTTSPLLRSKIWAKL